MTAKTIFEILIFQIFKKWFDNFFNICLPMHNMIVFTKWKWSITDESGLYLLVYQPVEGFIAAILYT